MFLFLSPDVVYLLLYWEAISELLQKIVEFGLFEEKFLAQNQNALDTLLEDLGRMAVYQFCNTILFQKEFLRTSYKSNKFAELNFEDLKKIDLFYNDPNYFVLVSAGQMKSWSQDPLKNPLLVADLEKYLNLFRDKFINQEDGILVFSLWYMNFLEERYMIQSHDYNSQGKIEAFVFSLLENGTSSTMNSPTEVRKKFFSLIETIDSYVFAHLYEMFEDYLSIAELGNALKPFSKKYNTIDPYHPNLKGYFSTRDDGSKYWGALADSIHETEAYKQLKEKNNEKFISKLIYKSFGIIKNPNKNLFFSKFFLNQDVRDSIIRSILVQNRFEPFSLDFYKKMEKRNKEKERKKKQKQKQMIQEKTNQEQQTEEKNDQLLEPLGLNKYTWKQRNR